MKTIFFSFFFFFNCTVLLRLGLLFEPSRRGLHLWSFFPEDVHWALSVAVIPAGHIRPFSSGHFVTEQGSLPSVCFFLARWCPLWWQEQTPALQPRWAECSCVTQRCCQEMGTLYINYRRSQTLLAYLNQATVMQIFLLGKDYQGSQRMHESFTGDFPTESFEPGSQSSLVKEHFESRI